MSQDMMQALSGSSLLSLSIGTLPAVKPGMNLDANPFASQLALMTGTDASVAGMLAPVAMSSVPGEGGFAATLADLAGLAESAPMALSSGEPAAPALPGMARPVAAPEVPIVAALPEEANTAQLIEAALTGAAKIAEAPVAPEGARVPEASRAPEAAPVRQTIRPAPQAPLAATTNSSTDALPVAGDDAAPGAAQGMAQPSLTVQPLPPASQVPHLKHLIRADAPMPIRAQLQPEAEPIVTDPVSTATPAPLMPVARADETPIREAQGEQVLPVAIAPVVAQAPAPRPAAPVTDLDTTSIAAKAAPEAPRQSAEPRSASASPERPAPRLPGVRQASDAPQPVAAAKGQPAIAPMAEAAPERVSQSMPAVPVQMPPVSVAADAAAAPAMPMTAAQDQTAAASPAPATAEIAPEAPNARKARVLRDPVAPTQSSAPEIPLGQPVIAPISAAAPSPAPVTGDSAPAAAPIAAATAAPQRMAAAPRQPSAPLSSPRVTTDAPIVPGPVEAQPAAPVDARAAAVPVAPAPAQPAAAPVRIEPANVPLMAAPDQAASAPLVSSDDASLAPAQSVQTGATTSEPRQQAPMQQAGAPQVIAPPVPASATASSEAVRIAETVPAAMAAPVQAPAPRAQVSPAARRVIDAALQTPRTADPRTTQFDRAELSVQSGTTSLAAEPGATLSTEAVPPAWAAALNAVNPQVQQASGTAAPQAAAQTAQAPVHNLAFDAGFVAGIESQIAKLVDGGQMMKIQVMPEHLGRIDIEMLAGPERDQVRIVTEHDAVRDTLVNAQHRLEQDLRSQGQRNTEVTVELRQQSPGTQNGSAQQQQQRGQSGAESASAREAAQRGANAETQTDTNPAPRRPRGNVRYA